MLRNVDGNDDPMTAVISAIFMSVVMGLRNMTSLVTMAKITAKVVRLMAHTVLSAQQAVRSAIPIQFLAMSQTATP